MANKQATAFIYLAILIWEKRFWIDLAASAMKLAGRAFSSLLVHPMASSAEPTQDRIAVKQTRETSILNCFLRLLVAANSFAGRKWHPWHPS